MEYCQTKRIMWTDITISIFWEEEAEEDIAAVFALFTSLEEECSRFRSSSVLSVLNKHWSIVASDRFVEVCKKCKDIYTETQGYFNPLISLRQIGYGADFQLNEFKKEDIHPRLDFENFLIQGNILTLQPWQQLDLWGIVKWFAVDRAKEYLDTHGYKNYIIDAGGDIFLCGQQEAGKRMLVGIDSPFIPWDLFATLEVQDTAIATSGNYRRKWRIDNHDYTHIINPLSGMNNNEIISITLVADQCYLADAYATACIAMGLEKTLAFLERMQMDGVIICADKRVFTTSGMSQYLLQKVDAS